MRDKMNFSETEFAKYNLNQIAKEILEHLHNPGDKYKEALKILSAKGI